MRLNIQILATVLLVIWIVLLLPWLLFAALSGMAFDTGNTFRACIFIVSLWTYPVSIWIAAKFKEERPAVSLLPLLNVLGIFSDLLWKSN